MSCKTCRGARDGALDADVEPQHSPRAPPSAAGNGPVEEPDRPGVQSFVEECLQAMPRRVTNITVNMDDDGGHFRPGLKRWWSVPLGPFSEQSVVHL